MKALLKSLRESVAHVRATMRLVWRSSRSMTLALGAVTLIAALLPLAIGWGGKRIVDAILAGQPRVALAWVGFELGMVAAQATASRSLALLRSVLGARLGVDVNLAILAKATTMDLADFENSETYDALTKARREASSRPVSLVTEAFQLVQNAITLGGWAVLLFRYSPLAAGLLAVAAIPATVAEMRSSKQMFRFRNWRSPDSRKLLYLEHVLANDEHAKEVKIFGLAGLFLGRYRDLAERFYREDRAQAVKRAAISHGLSLLATLVFYGTYGSMALAAAAGALTLGSMTLYVTAFRSGQGALGSVLGAIGSIYEHNLYMSNLFRFLETGAKKGSSTALALPAAAASDERGIRFDHVTFRYDGKDAPALEDVSLFIPAGESVALVGENGAGKTTFVKLLARLYAPTSGRILLDGRDLAAWDEDALRGRLGVVFQDFAQYQLPVSENVGVGSVGHLTDEARLGRAIERGGATEVIDALPAKGQTQLGRWFKDGTELSGGQWQKVALARAFMREEADILVLDEPTAALDAKAEHAVFQRFRELAEGRTTIVISHRFPTVRMADRILVLEQGKVVEEGTHASLVAEAGRYATMFHLQAEGYR
ncbi:MAG TPA: ABC transporter ATP-binding protein [Polyangiaceae bacterium]